MDQATATLLGAAVGAFGFVVVGAFASAAMRRQVTHWTALGERE